MDYPVFLAAFARFLIEVFNPTWSTMSASA
jgi:hypothetical protein